MLAFFICMYEISIHKKGQFSLPLFIMFQNGVAE